MIAAPIVFFDIAGPDSGALRTFYSLVFGWESDAAGQFSVHVDGPLLAAIRQDPAGNPLGLVELEDGKPKVP